MKTTTQAAVTATQVHAMLRAHAALIKADYPHIKLPTESECSDFLAGKPGKIVNRSFGGIPRSHQFKQMISLLGGFVVDAKKADAETVRIYKAVWEIEETCTCKYCGKPFKFALMLGNNQGVCNKPRCTLQHMRDSM